ncbi:RDD family protein [Herbihabitans rhizosphaerae]|uniref:RDD family protein n=1 Tax=Herbihabitans rhizosphaerae TaxID=1872711 RepID=A0A4V2ESJ2_9PSEU|nr:RDD family protein [Herbihabitans rhizosphaerae]RZS37763.1 RDD family protein [Herbihabitans rhizosphaerae]
MSFELVPARFRDVRRLRRHGAPASVALPAKHGGIDDPRYPSGTGLGVTLGFVIDFALHVGVGVGACLALQRLPALERFADLAWLGLLLGFLLASIVHRIFVQRLTHTTLGKAIFGVCLIRSDTGGPPTLWSLVKVWLRGVLGVLGSGV